MYYTAIKHDGHLRTRGKCERRAYSTFLECSQMSGVLYHSVIHSLGSLICFQNNKTHFFMFHTLIKHDWVLGQSEHAQGPI